MNNKYVENQIMLAGQNNFASRDVEASIIYVLITMGAGVESQLARLKESDFFYREYANIYRAIQATANKGLTVDLVTVDSTIHAMYGDNAQLVTDELYTLIGSNKAHKLNLDSYIAVVQELAVRRKSIAMMQDMITKLNDPSQDMSAVLETLRNESRQLSTPQGNHNWDSMNDILISTFNYLEKRANGEITSITTGLSNVDALIGGFFGGELTIIGARPSVGKSAFGVNIAIEAAKKGYKIGIVSREMTDTQFGQRLLARAAGIDGMKLRKAELNEDDWSAISSAICDLSTLKINYMFNVRTVEDLRREAEKRVENKELDLLIVDYLQLMETSIRYKDEHLRVGHISKTLKDIALDLNIPVIALAQVNRNTDGAMPTLANLKDSGDIEQDADGVIFLHRPMDSSDTNIDPRDKGNFELIRQKGFDYIVIGVAKQRQGTIGKACVLFDKAHMKYRIIKRM